MKQAAEWLVIQLLVRRLTSAEVSHGADGHTALCDTSLWWSTSIDRLGRSMKLRIFVYIKAHIDNLQSGRPLQIRCAYLYILKHTKLSEVCYYAGRIPSVGQTSGLTPFMLHLILRYCWVDVNASVWRPILLGLEERGKYRNTSIWHGF